MKFIELFAGAGGMGLGLEAAGMEHLLSYEVEKAQHSVLVHNGKDAIRMDLADVGRACLSMHEVPDIIVGGPPCQDWSRQGKRKPGLRALLTEHFAQIICLVRPQWFLFENVPEARDKSEYRNARALWKRHGYGLTEVECDAQDYGVPQRRKRLFCIGRLDEIDGFLVAEIEAAKQRPVVIRDILDPKRYPEDAELLEKGIFFARPWMGKKDEPNGRGILSIDEVCPTVTRNTHGVPKEGYIPHPKDSGLLENAHHLTPSQVARIQGFPADYDFRRKAYDYAREGIAKHTINLMVANAVPAPLAQAIGKVIYDRHYGFSIPELDEGFTELLQQEHPKTENILTAESIANVRSRVNRARRMIGGRMFSNIALEIQALEQSYDLIRLHDEARRTYRYARGKKFKDLPKRLRSDLRQALRLYHFHRTAALPRPPKPEKLPNFKVPPTPTKRLKRKGAALLPTTPKHVIDQILAGPLNLNSGGSNPKNEVLNDFFGDDFFFTDLDVRHPQPPRPDDDWRPEGYELPDADDLAAILADD